MVKHLRLRSPRAAIALLGTAAAIAATAAGASGATSVKPYVEPVGSEYDDPSRSSASTTRCR